MRSVLAKYFRTLINLSTLEIYTDGSSKNGVGSWAYVISRRGRIICEVSGRVRRAQSTSMEFRAAIEALNFVPVNSKVTLFSDSKILIDAMTLGSCPKSFETEIEKLLEFKSKLRTSWVWIKGHNGNRFNERCDELCTLARSGSY